MSPDTDMSCQSYPGRPAGKSQWRGCAPGEPWKAVEVLAMVLGFIVFWPIGLAVLGWKIWQRKSGYPGDIVAFGREKWGNSAQWRAGRWGFAANRWHGFSGGTGSTGNRAFDDWRSAELARLEEEHRRLAAAEREFAEYMDNLRHAKDREEFERFMNERRNRQGGPALHWSGSWRGVFSAPRFPIHGCSVMGAGRGRGSKVCALGFKIPDFASI